MKLVDGDPRLLLLLLNKYVQLTFTDLVWESLLMARD
jgi:hypothetical protein